MTLQRQKEAMIQKSLLGWPPSPLPQELPDFDPNDPNMPSTPSTQNTLSSVSERYGLIKATTGSCTQNSEEGSQCTCRRGSVVIPADRILSNEMCGECHHPMSAYHYYVYPSNPPPLLLHSDICPRDDAICKLAALLDDMLVVHVRGTPSSGKTTLTGLLYHHYV
jgi:hypothetical protein